MNNLSDKISNLELKIYRGDNYEFKTIEGTVFLKAWSGFQSRQGAYVSIDKSLSSDDFVKLKVGGDMVIDNPQITDDHINAYNYLKENQEQIKDSILNSLLIEYKDLQELYDYDKETATAIMPVVDNNLQFQNLIGLSTVHLMNVSKDGIAYIGYEFGCTWDDEHGLGIMTHKNRIIKIGLADTSFLTWVAEEDINPEENNYHNETEIKRQNQKDKKPWWKFW